MRKNLSKRIIFILFVILLMLSVGKTIFELKEGIMFHTHENACAHDYWGRWDNFVIWNAFSWCVFEILYNVTFFWVYKRERPYWLEKLNKISLVLAVIQFGFCASLLILLNPIIAFVYYIVRLVYAIFVIREWIGLQKQGSVE